MFSSEQELCDMMKRNSGARWGNKFGMILLPIYCQKAGADPLQYLKSAKAIIDRKKQSIEAHFSYKTGDLVMSLFGPKVNMILEMSFYWFLKLYKKYVEKLFYVSYCSMLAG